MPTKKDILGDHVRQGKVFKPPLSQFNIVDKFSWTKVTMPELLWIGLVFERFGMKESVDLCLSLAQEAEAEAEDGKGFCFAFTSSFDVLDNAQREAVRNELETSTKLSRLRTALKPLVRLYPGCPLRFLFDEDLEMDAAPNLDYFKTFLGSLFNKRDRTPVLMQAQAVYTLGASGRLFIKEGTSLGNLDELRLYPNTPESKKVGALVCAACNMLVGQTLEEHDSGWAKYFWERGYELDDCEYELPYEI